jgi:glycerol-3-phosphate dehydrogenase
MLRDTRRLARGQYDLLVIGGGINGAAIAHLGVCCGLRVALLEKGDFASGTSSKTTKLIHGGLRYLEHLEFDFVRESLKERAIQLKSAPHLVKPIPFIIPVYKTDRRPLWMMKLGVWLYDLLSTPYSLGHYRSLSAEEIVQLVPELNRDGLVGGVEYYDAQMDDARLCLENVLSADAKGAHVANYTEVVSFIKENGKVIGVQARDLLEKTTFEVRSKKTVCAVGPWSNLLLKMDNRHTKPRIRPTKGIHIVYRPQISPQALVIPSHQDNRIFFVIPWKGHSLVGTTDTDYTASPDEVGVEEEDIRYLLEESKRVFPQIEFKKEDIITTFAGLRPLVDHAGQPSKVSRKHTIEETYSGLIFVTGGKYTAYRKIAEECLRKFTPIPVDTDYPLYGAGEIKETPQDAAKRCELPKETIELLMSQYGTRYQDVLRLTETDPQLRERLCGCSPMIEAQVVYAIQTEMAQTLDDIVWRRLGLGFYDCPTKNCREVIQRILKEHGNY